MKNVLVTACALLLSTAGVSESQPTGANGGRICSQTALAAYAACQNGVRTDYWIATGRCLNIADPDVRRSCLDETKRVRADALQECADQREARVELCDALGEGPYDPAAFVPGNFVDPLEIGGSVAPNSAFPLIPGSRWVYSGGDETITVEVLGEVKEISGVPCTVVRDVVEEDGETVEHTLDWYAQHIDGTVWYCGELSQEFEEGELASLEGSWKAGQELARAGIIMLAFPQTGDVYRQEFALGDAEDAAEIFSRSGSATVPAASCDGTCLVTRDFTPLEPGVSELKYYAPSIGLILEVDLETGQRVELVNYRIP